MLSVYHTYYFQVQAQLKLSGTHYCDFVVWREGGLIIQRIYLDETIHFHSFRTVQAFHQAWYPSRAAGQVVLKRTNIFEHSYP